MTDEEYFAECEKHAALSPDPSRKTGAIIVDRWGDIIAHGFNCFPHHIRGRASRLERPAKYKWIEHAERNAIYYAAANGIETSGCKMYLSWYPCAECARAIIQAELTWLVCREPDWEDPRWADDFAIVKEMLAEALVSVRFVGKFEERAA